MIKLFIVGSCVSRDAFSSENTSLFEIVDYIARTSLASAFERTRFKGVHLDRIKSVFQRRMVETDINKKLLRLFLENKADYILLDMIDERLNLIIASDGAVATASNEFRSSGYLHAPGESKTSIIPSMSEEFYTRWERGWRRLIKILHRSCKINHLIVNRCYWSAALEDGSKFKYCSQTIAKANDFLDRLYRRMELDLKPQQFINYPRQLLVGAVHHKWGIEPFHYIDAFYNYTRIKIAQHQMNFPQMQEMDYYILQRHKPLTNLTQWLEVISHAGATWCVETEVDCDEGVMDRRALVSLDFTGRPSEPLILPEGFFISDDPSVGVYRYLATGTGKIRDFFTFTLPINCSGFHIGIRSWYAENNITLIKMTAFCLNKQ